MSSTVYIVAHDLLWGGRTQHQRTAGGKFDAFPLSYTSYHITPFSIIVEFSVSSNAESDAVDETLSLDDFKSQLSPAVVHMPLLDCDLARTLAICVALTLILLLLLFAVSCVANFWSELFGESRLATIRIPHEIHILDLRNPKQAKKRVYTAMVMEPLYDGGGRRDIHPGTVLVKKRVEAMTYASPEDRRRDEAVIREQGFLGAYIDFSGSRLAPLQANIGKRRAGNDGSRLSGL